MSEYEVKPCPFCGAVPDIDDPNTFRFSQGDKWGALQCCCEGPEVRTWYEPLERWRGDAIREWNIRTEDDRIAAQDRKIEALEAENARLREEMKDPRRAEQKRAGIAISRAIHRHRSKTLDFYTTLAMERGRKIEALEAENARLREESAARLREIGQWVDASKDIFAADHMLARHKAEAQRDEWRKAANGLAQRLGMKTRDGRLVRSYEDGEPRDNLWRERTRREEAEALRDELAEALRSIEAACPPPEHQGMGFEVHIYRTARAALAKLEEE